MRGRSYRPNRSEATYRSNDELSNQFAKLDVFTDGSAAGVSIDDPCKAGWGFAAVWELPAEAGGGFIFEGADGGTVGGALPPGWEPVGTPSEIAEAVAVMQAVGWILRHPVCQVRIHIDNIAVMHAAAAISERSSLVGLGKASAMAENYRSWGQANKMA